MQPVMSFTIVEPDSFDVNEASKRKSFSSEFVHVFQLIFKFAGEIGANLQLVDEIW